MVIAVQSCISDRRAEHVAGASARRCTRSSPGASPSALAVRFWSPKRSAVLTADAAWTLASREPAGAGRRRRTAPLRSAHAIRPRHPRPRAPPPAARSTPWARRRGSRPGWTSALALSGPRRSSGITSSSIACARDTSPLLKRCSAAATIRSVHAPAWSIGVRRAASSSSCAAASVAPRDAATAAAFSSVSADLAIRSFRAECYVRRSLLFVIDHRGKHADAALASSSWGCWRSGSKRGLGG